MICGKVKKEIKKKKRNETKYRTYKLLEIKRNQKKPTHTHTSNNMK